MNAEVTQVLVVTLALFQQPYMLAALAIVTGGVMLKLSVGKSGIGGLVLFIPRLFLDVLDIIHTKKFKYYGLVLALIALEAGFAFRAAQVYYDVLSAHIPSVEMIFIVAIIFVAIFLCGFMVTTHEGPFNWQRWLTAIVVFLHDCAGVVWMNYQPAAGSKVVAGTTLEIVLNGVLTFGMCAFAILPFMIGKWAEELRPQMSQELDEEVEQFTEAATRKIKRRAVNRVLSLVNHTDVVQLVEALPDSEFDDFKSFVMPIIAPGKITVKNEPIPAQNLAENPEEKQPELDADLAQLFDLQTEPKTNEKTTQKLAENYGQNREKNTDEIPQVPPQKKTQKSNKTGLTFSAAARLECCQKKGIKSSDIRAAVLAQKLRRFSDGSVSKNAVEKWAKSYAVPTTA